jgi:hypothetical protein
VTFEDGILVLRELFEALLLASSARISFFYALPVGGVGILPCLTTTTGRRSPPCRTPVAGLEPRHRGVSVTSVPMTTQALIIDVSVRAAPAVSPLR